jgi:hypothetical protein
LTQQLSSPPSNVVVPAFADATGEAIARTATVWNDPLAVAATDTFLPAGLSGRIERHNTSAELGWRRLAKRSAPASKALGTPATRSLNCGPTRTIDCFVTAEHL